MPELPEVETVVRGLTEQVLNREISDVKIHLKRMVSGSPTQFKKILVGSVITHITRHGKYLFIHLNNAYSFVVHLRMTGQLFITPNERAKDPHTHLEFLLSDSESKIIYRDIRTFGRFTLIKTAEVDEYIADRNLGGDALTITKKEFIENLSRKKISLKAALLDQKVIAGIGNIYADEILYREQLNPLTAPASLTEIQSTRLLKSIKSVLKEAVLKKGTTFSDYVNSYGEKGTFQLILKAYGRAGEPCRRCKTLLVKTKVAGRGTYFCPQCQRLT